MSSSAFAASDEVRLPSMPAWLWSLLGVTPAAEGEPVELAGQKFVSRDGILRSVRHISLGQAQTAESFEFKWRQRETFESPASRTRMRDWLIERYGRMDEADWLFETSESPILLDAGCGAAMSAIELFEPVFDRVRYLGVDISGAIDIARARFAERGLQGGFLQADIMDLPLPDASADVIFSEGVLHHADSTKNALGAIVRVLKPGGRVMFYVYRRKGPIREFTDDYVREKLQHMTPEEAWRALTPLTKLGRALGELRVEVEVPEAIDLLGIPAGRFDLQRLIYWHVFKAFHLSGLSLEELNHINYDWYAPKNAHRQSPEEVRQWCGAADLDIERERVEEAGITVVARKRP